MNPRKRAYFAAFRHGFFGGLCAAWILFVLLT